MVQVLNRSSNEAPLSERVQRKNDARRLEILRAAARVFRRLGLSAAGMREIAEEADLSPGNLYYYFSGKDEILLFCQERTLERLLASVEEARTASGSCSGRLRGVMSAHVRCMLDELEGATANLEVEVLPEAMSKEVVETRDTYARAVRGRLAAAVELRDIAISDPV